MANIQIILNTTNLLKEKKKFKEEEEEQQMAYYNSACSINPLTIPTVLSYPECQLNIQPEIPMPCEMGYDEPKSTKTSWLKYLFACCFLLTCAAFITFLVLFIIAVSGGMGQNAGRMVEDKNLNKDILNTLRNLYKCAFKSIEC